MQRLVAVGLLQTDIAHLLEVSKGTISSWASGAKAANSASQAKLRELIEEAEAGAANGGVAAELEIKKRLAQQRAAAEEREVAAIRNQVAQEAAEAGHQAAQRRQLEEAQERALAAHGRIAELDRELAPAIERLVGIVNEMIEARGVISRGLDFESYALRDGRLQRATVLSGLKVAPGHAARLLRAGREVARLGGVALEKAEIEAAQMVRLC